MRPCPYLCRFLPLPSTYANPSPHAAHWLQISGATVLACGEIASKTFGEPSDKVYHDLDSGEIWAQVKRYPSRAVDNYIHDVATQDAGTVNTALLVGPIIFGAGRGPGNRRSIQIPELARTAIERRRAWQVGRGLSVWDHVHVRDLSGITLRLVERAVGGGGGGDQSGLWGEEGVYFAGVGHLVRFSFCSPGPFCPSFEIIVLVRSANVRPRLLTQAFADISRRIAAAAYALDLADSPDAVDSLPPAEADKLVGHASILLGTNARCDAKRAVEKLGWNPKEQSLEQAIEETVRDEAGKVGKAEL